MTSITHASQLAQLPTAVCADFAADTSARTQAATSSNTVGRAMLWYSLEAAVISAMLILAAVGTGAMLWLN